MVTISAREANQQFSKILQAAEAGEEVLITRRGKPVAKLVAVVAPDAEAAERERRRQEALAFFRRGLKGGKVVDLTRDEIYLDRFERPWEPVE